MFEAIGTTWGAGDGSTTFNIPDLRGYFLRGVGGNSAALAVEQGDAIRSIKGSFDDVLYSGHVGPFGPHAGGVFYTDASAVGVRYGASGQIELSETGDNIQMDVARQAPIAEEIRPVNKAVNYIIVYE